MNGVIGFTYNGNTYYYEKNIQGDVTAIVDVNGTIKAKYTYDAWGNHTITLDTNGIGTLNPFRYRSYYYDTEIGLYYLNSRYYDSVACRFINADSIIDAGGILGYNMFVYCSNNPIMRKDPSGKTFLYDPDEPDWASSYNQAQLDMIYRVGIDEFASYDSWVQDAMLYSALMGESFIGDRGGEIHNYLMENAQMGRSHNQFANEYYDLVIQEELWDEPVVQMLCDFALGGWADIDEKYKMAKVTLAFIKTLFVTGMTTDAENPLQWGYNTLSSAIKAGIVEAMYDENPYKIYTSCADLFSSIIPTY